MINAIGALILMAIASFAYPFIALAFIYTFLGNVLVLEGFKSSESKLLGYIAGSLYFAMVIKFFFFLFGLPNAFYLILLDFIMCAVIFYLHHHKCRKRNEENKLLKDIYDSFTNCNNLDEDKWQCVLMCVAGFFILGIEGFILHSFNLHL